MYEFFRCFAFFIATFCNTALYIETRFTFHYVAISEWRHLVDDGMGGGDGGGCCESSRTAIVGSLANVIFCLFIYLLDRMP